MGPSARVTLAVLVTSLAALLSTASPAALAQSPANLTRVGDALVRQGYVSRCEQRPSNPQRRVRRVGRAPRQRHLQRLITGSYVDAV